MSSREPIMMALTGVGLLVVLAGAVAVLLTDGALVGAGSAPLVPLSTTNEAKPRPTASTPVARLERLLISSAAAGSEGAALDRLAAARATLRDASASGPARANALRALAALAPEEGMREAFQLLASGTSPGLDAAALRLVERFVADLQPAAQREAVRLVRAVLGRTQSPEAALAAGAVLDALIGQDPSLVDARVLEGALPSVPLPEGRVALLRALGLVRSQDGEGFLAYCEQLAANDPAPAVRVEAVVQGLRDRTRRERGLALAMAAIRRDPQVQDGAIRALASSDDPAVRDRLEALFLNASSPSMLRSLARALAARPTTVPAIMAKAALGSGPRAAVAVDAIGQALTKDRERLLRQVLQEGASPAARSGALLALYQHERLGKQELLALKADASAEVRQAAEASLRDAEQLPPEAE